MNRRQLTHAAPLAWLATGPGTAAAWNPGEHDYDAAVQQIWRTGPLRGLEGRALGLELVRCATLAPSSHNTQCWRFAIAPDAITVLPDFSRRCPAVDPDDHHLFVSLGCATENLVQAAGAQGLWAEARFEPAQAAVRVTLATGTPQAGALCAAIPARQCTRGTFDGHPLATGELKQLAAAAAGLGVQCHLFTERAALERILSFVVEGNTAQIRDPAFVRELKQWLRFNAADAVRLGDGLYTAASGNPTAPAWLGRLLFDLFFTPGAEADRYAQQVRSAAGVAVFVAEQADAAHWVAVGRAYQRFALQATALGVRNAMLNQPVEVAALRPRFATALDLGPLRPDLVVRFGRGPTLPRSLRRPVSAVLV